MTAHPLPPFSQPLLLTTLLPLSAHHPRTNHDNRRLTVTVEQSRSLYVCLADKTALLNVSAVKTHAASHAHRWQTRLPAGGDSDQLWH